jgi:hypothetical protein
MLVQFGNIPFNIRKKNIICGLQRVTVEYLMENFEQEDLILLLRHCRMNNAQAFYGKDIPTILTEQKLEMEELKANG